MIKTAETIKPGDVFVTEYGDFDNYCAFVFVSCQPHKQNCTEITVHPVNDNNNIFNIYDMVSIDKVRFDVKE